MISKEKITTVIHQEIDFLLRKNNQNVPSIIDLESAVIGEIGFDSVSMVELICNIERGLEIEQVSLNAWFDQEEGKKDQRYTLASLRDFLWMSCNEHDS